MTEEAPPQPTILQVAVLAPGLGCFDYLPPDNYGTTPILNGTRVRVEFGRRQRVGMVIGVSTHSELDRQRLKPVLQVLDATPIFDSPLLELVRWTSSYYHHPIGAVLRDALPKRLRDGDAVASKKRLRWRINPGDRDLNPELLKNAPRQRQILCALSKHPEGLDGDQLASIHPHWREPVKRLLERGMVIQENQPCLARRGLASDSNISLNVAQANAVNDVVARLGRFSAWVVDGVTGSGKTEVYFQLIEEVMARGQQTLVLVPEIGLTPQLVERFHRRFNAPLAVLHSALSDGERHCAWYMVLSGQAPVVVGTRSAVFTPLARPGLIVVDEEHDPSLKQQDGFRYHARDLAVFRAHQYGVPVILGSATPSLESLHNVDLGKYRHITLPERAGAARHPEIRIIDLRRRPMEEGISDLLRQEIDKHLRAGGQVLLFLNRRGYAPALVCHTCGWIAPCQRCDTPMTLHRESRRLRCHHCEATSPIPQVCTQCGGGDLRPVGQGTERVEDALRRWFPEVSAIRIDRDTIRRKGDMKARLEEIQRGEHQILIGTQMLSKGHDFPKVTLVGILDIDQGLYSTDFRAPERLAQLVVQVSGRAGRADRPGTVLLQTHLPDHPLLRFLLRADYGGFARSALAERREAGLPPYRHLAMLRAEATTRDAPTNFLDLARGSLASTAPDTIQILGPIPAPMERRAGHYRAQLLIIAPQRSTLQTLLDRCPPLDGIRGSRKVRWSLDVDPVDLF